MVGDRDGDLRTISMLDISRTTLRAERKGELGCAELGDVHNRSNSGCAGFSSVAAGSSTLQSSSLMAAGLPSSSDNKLSVLAQTLMSTNIDASLTGHKHRQTTTLAYASQVHSPTMSRYLNEAQCLVRSVLQSPARPSLQT